MDITNQTYSLETIHDKTLQHMVQTILDTLETNNQFKSPNIDLYSDDKNTWYNAVRIASTILNERDIEHRYTHHLQDGLTDDASGYTLYENYVLDKLPYDQTLISHLLMTDELIVVANNPILSTYGVFSTDDIKQTKPFLLLSKSLEAPATYTIKSKDGKVLKFYCTPLDHADVFGKTITRLAERNKS